MVQEIRGSPVGLDICSPRAEEALRVECRWMKWSILNDN
jgi:hypothetical protein